MTELGGTTLPDGVIMACFGTLVIPMLDVLRVAVTRTINHRNIFLRDNNALAGTRADDAALDDDIIALDHAAVYPSID